MAHFASDDLLHASPQPRTRTTSISSFSSTASHRASWSGGPNSKRKLFAGKALEFSSRFLAKGAEYLEKEGWEGAAASLSRADEKVRAAKEQREWGEWDGMTSNREMQVGGRRTPVPGSRSASPSPSLEGLSLQGDNAKGKGKAAAGAAGGGAAAGNHSYLSYFGKQQREQRNRQTFTEEHVVCFPGYAALRSPSHSQAGDIDIFLSGYCYRTRPSHAALTRSQRLLISFARKWTGLPSLPRNTAPGCENTETETELDAEAEDDLIDLNSKEGDAKDKTFAALVELGEGEADEVPTPSETQRPQRSFTAEPQEMDLPPLPSSSSQQNTPKPSHPPSGVFADPTPTSTPLRPPKLPSAKPSGSSTGSGGSMTSNRRAGTPLTRRNSFDGLDLHQLHHNLQERLQGFFGQKMEGRRVAIEVYVSSDSTSLAISQHQRPLLTRVVTTRAGGAWGEKLTLPWQTLEAYLKVREGRLDKSPETGVRRLRVRVELLKDHHHGEGLVEMAREVMGGGEGEGEMGMERRIVERVVEVTPASGAGGFHLVSDIDDTIKKTEVLGGMRSIFRNVFLWAYEEVVVPGMAEWYRTMQENGVVIHYVSNSPWELWYPIERYLAIAGFPPGSVSLKEYASIITNMWESAGARKRARIDALMREFPSARFLFVGDSGEQDLEVYTSLAHSHPGRVVGIFIRDVTTLPNEKRPAPGSARSSLSSGGGNGVGKGQEMWGGTDVHAPTPRGNMNASPYTKARTHRATPSSSSIPSVPGALPDASPKTAPRRLPPAPPPAHEGQSSSSSSSSSLAAKDFAQNGRPTTPQPASSRSAPVPSTSAPAPQSPSRSSFLHRPSSSASSFSGDYYSDAHHLPHHSASTPAASDPSTSTTQTPTTYEEDLKRKAVLEAWWARVAKAEVEAPPGTEIRLFRTGGECVEEAVEMLERAGYGGGGEGGEWERTGSAGGSEGTELLL